MKKTGITIIIAAATLAPANLMSQTAVDLGLSVRWANCNMGAVSPTETGDYYAWGEVTGKGAYKWESYVFWNEESFQTTKYNAGFSKGMQLEDADEVVKKEKGSPWRMPTSDEMEELCLQCKWEWTTEKDMNGYRVTGKNGNSIFLPASGYRDDNTSRGKVKYLGTAGRYWTSTRHPYHPRCAMYLFFNDEYNYTYFYERFRGFSVRPVCP